MSRGSNSRRRPGTRAFFWLCILLVVMMLAGLFGTLRYVVRNVTERKACVENLQRIYRTLGLYEMAQGNLPELAFFPRDARVDSDSLRVVLGHYGLRDEHMLCPSCGPQLREVGLSYLWNPRLNGAELYRVDPPTWMLVEIQAMSDDVKGPHFRGFHVLYTDGRVEHTDRIPVGLRGGLSLSQP